MAWLRIATINHVHREGNRRADALANEAFTRNTFLFSVFICFLTIFLGLDVVDDDAKA
ncbi:hypothetical protein LOK49_LG15G01595 [Camellia lanceoleosa]|uniref:Uncharacterized protein n=1 Tax=Camellia lanceoleosa TaxID=1840588 RepID=A0ACC0F8L3_9ERIC|nr:hypothetical protein LOK49_LG15G01595 [Camellia lanceoleosa]